MNLALGKVECSPFDVEVIHSLRLSVMDILEERGVSLVRDRFMQLMLAAEDPEVSIGTFARGVRVGRERGSLDSQHFTEAKKNGASLNQSDPLDYLEEAVREDEKWRSNYSAVAEPTEETKEVMDGQAARGLVIKLAESEAHRRFPQLVIALLGALRKDKPYGAVTARVLFDGTYGISVNRRTQVRHQTRAPIAADLKRAMRKKSRWGSALSH